MKSLLAGFLVLGFSISTNAAVVTHGDLTTDDSTNYITDINTGRQYTRFDAFDFTYTETLAAIASGSGSEWEGWSIASAAVSDDFIASALGVTNTPCDNANISTLCGYIQGWSDGDFGASFDTFTDHWVYISDTSGFAGLAAIRNDDVVVDHHSWNTLTYPDNFGGNADHINYLLYRNITVPESTSLYLLAFGLLGLFGAARRKV